jgi:hypothetical protein
VREGTSPAQLKVALTAERLGRGVHDLRLQNIAYVPGEAPAVAGWVDDLPVAVPTQKYPIDFVNKS